MPHRRRSEEGAVHEVLTQSDDPADALIEAARQRDGRDTLMTRAMLWLVVAFTGTPIIVSVFRVASAFIG